MQFIDSERDPVLLSEILTEQVFSRADFDAMEQPEDGYLMDVLVNNASRVDEKKWLYWLLKRHKLARIGAIGISETWVRGLGWPLSTVRQCIKDDCFPVREFGGALYMGVGRPDSIDIENLTIPQGRYKAFTPVALTLTELKNVREQFRAFIMEAAQ